MSYDVSFKVKAEGVDRYVDTGYCDANITWNVRKIIEVSTGLPWNNESNNGLCVDVMPKIADGHANLISNPRLYRQYEAENGWGTVEGTIRFFEEILRAWREFCVCEEDLIPIVTFWIE